MRGFFLKRVLNRKILHCHGFKKKIVGVGTVFNTGGHSSYPQVAENQCLYHEIVNHSYGFVADNGKNKNKIEGFWAMLKKVKRDINTVNED